MFDEGEDVGEDLAGVVFVVRPLITGTREWLAKRSMISCSKVRIMTSRSCAISPAPRPPPARRVRAANPRIQVDRRSAQLLHAGLEGEARAGAGLLENHHQSAVLQGPVALIGLEARLDRPGGSNT